MSPSRFLSVGIIVVMILALAFETVYASLRINALQHEVVELSKRLQAQDDNLPSREEQASCAQQAEQFVADRGYGLSGGSAEERADFGDHFNVKLRKCFVVIRTNTFKSGEHLASTKLFDALEGKNYGKYVWSGQKDKELFEGPPLECQVIASDGSSKICRSKDEFDSLATGYMNVAE